MNPKTFSAIEATLSAFLLGFAFTVNADTFLVPDDFPTIQEAVEAVNPDGGDFVIVGPGEYAGAIIKYPVKIVGSGDNTRITSGTYLDPEIAFTLYGPLFDVDGTEISNLEIEYEGLQWGIFGFLANDVKISNVTVKNAFRAIDSHLGDNWTITHNIIEGLIVPAGLTGAHVDGIALIGGGGNNVVAHNYVHHEGAEIGLDEAYTGIGVATYGALLRNNNIHHNQVHISVPDATFCFNVVLWDIGVTDYGLPLSLVNNKVHHNHSWGECDGVSFLPDEVRNYTKLHHNNWAE